MPTEKEHGKGGKGLFGKVAELAHDAIFVETGEHKIPDETPAHADQSDEVPVFKASRSSASSPAPLTATAAAGSVDPSQVADIELMLEKRNSPTYTKFNDLLSCLSALPNDQKFTAAVATAPAAGINPKLIRASYDERLSNLDSLKAQFEEQSSREYQKRVKGTEDELEQIDEKIAQLQKQIDGLKSDRAAKAASVDESKNEIAAVKASMLASFAAVRAKVTTEREEIARHI